MRKMPVLVIIASVFLSIILILAVIGEAIAPYDYRETDILNAMLPPAFAEGGQTTHLLGTDNLGRDILSRILFSIRITVVIAFTGTATEVDNMLTVRLLRGEV